MNPQLLSIALSQCCILTTAQLEAAGVSREARRRMRHGGELVYLRRGIHTPGELWDAADHRGRHRITLAGALFARGWSPAVTSQRFAGGLRTAAFLHDLPFAPAAESVAALRQVLRPKDLSPEAWAVKAEVEQIWRGEGPRHVDLISADRCRRGYKHGVEVRPASLPSAHVVLNEGVPITSMARTAIDLMREGPMSDAVIAADGALHLGLERDELRSMANFCVGWPNGRQAIDAVAFANELAESAAESLARWVCAQEKAIAHQPELQVRLYDAFGLIGRVDLLFRAFQVVVEVDGLIKYLDPFCGDARQAIEEQEAREERLRRAGWTVIRTTWQELTLHPERFLGRLLGAFRAAA